MIIPDEIFNEIAIRGSGQPAAVEVQTLPWSERRSVGSASLLAVMLQRHPLLDTGEAEASVLAFELGAERVLLDETEGRAVASSIGPLVTGVLGILKEAKKQWLIPAVKPLMDDLITLAGFWIDSALYARVLMSFDNPNG